MKKLLLTNNLISAFWKSNQGNASLFMETDLLMFYGIGIITKPTEAKIYND